MTKMKLQFSLIRMAVVVALFAGGRVPAQAYVSFTCPVTQPTGVHFKPSNGFANEGSNLFGDERLFTLFPGNWDTTQRQGSRYRIPKIVWGSNLIDLSKEWEENTLTITGRRLDGVSAPLEFDRAHTARNDKGFFITSEFFVPTLGCWEVTGHFHGSDLKIIVDLRQHSDLHKISSTDRLNRVFSKPANLDTPDRSSN